MSLLKFIQDASNLLHFLFHHLQFLLLSPISHYNSYKRMGIDELRYLLTAFRTKKTYLCFHIAQLLLSITIIIIALTSKSHFKTPIVLVLEFVLFLTLAFDL